MRVRELGRDFWESLYPSLRQVGTFKNWDERSNGASFTPEKTKVILIGKNRGY
jgi:hypothetical protein